MSDIKTKQQALADAGFVTAEETSDLHVTIDIATIDKQIAEHESQFNALAQQLTTLEGEFGQKRDWAHKTLSELRGAIYALRGLKETVAPAPVPAEASVAE
jgi:hypothetical protein